MAGRARPLLDRWLDPLEWSPAERCLLASVIVLAGVLLFLGAIVVSAGWPYLSPGAAREDARLLGALALGIAAAWAVLLAAALAARRRAPRSRALVHTTVQIYALTIGPFTCLTGPFYSPGWIAFLGGAMVGFLLFDRAATALGVVTFLSLVAAGAALIELDAVPAITRLARLSGGDEAHAWLRLAVCSVAFTALTLALAAHIIARWRAREAELELLSRTDALTGLTNRRRFLEMFEGELQRAARYGRQLACVVVDVDHFKRINDTHGHLVGDEVLAAVARTLPAEVRDVDVVARLGGEEFAILLPDTGAAGAGEVAARCRRALEASPVVARGAAVPVTASMGVAGLPHPQVRRVEDLLRLADEALYRAKAEGRNRVVVA